jgi:hypothetical protein
MSERPPDFGDQYIAPPQDPVEFLAAAIEANDVNAVARANMMYIDEVYGKARESFGASRPYTEVHQVGESIVIMPGTVPEDMHYATIGQGHSMVNGARPFVQSSEQRLEQKLIETLQLSSETAVAKGYLAYKQGDVYDLQLASVNADRTGAVSWIDTFTQRANAYRRLHIDYTPPEKNQTMSFGEALPLQATPLSRIDAQHVEVKGEHTRNVAGVVTGVSEIEPPQTIKSADGSLKRQGHIVLSAIEGNSLFHEGVYTAAGEKRPAIFTVKMGELSQDVFLQYYLTNTEAGKTAEVNLIYRDAPGTQAFEDLNTMITTAIDDYLGDLVPPENRQITISHETTQKHA